MDIRLFGVMRAFRNDAELSLGSLGQKAVLAVLALHSGRVVTMDRLVEQLWGESPPSEPVHVVRVYVSRLRRVIEEDSASPLLLVTEAGGYRLAIPPDSVDALRFEQVAEGARSAGASGDQARARGLADQALEMWSDEPMVEFTGQQFAEHWRRRLEMVRSDLVEIWAGAVLATGAATTMLDRLEDLLAMEPYRERAWGHLAIAHYREGRQTEALRTLDRAKKTLADVGLEPGRELRDLEEAVFRHDTSLLVAPTPGVHNLPISIDRFVGRRVEADHLADLLRERRLVTIVGPGGSGKTRLATEIARNQIPRFPDGVWMVDLVPIDGEQLIATTMETLAAPPHAGRWDVNDVTRYLRHRQLLLLLDNCEHLVDEIARLATTVLHGCPGVRILTTSREPLRVSGEARYHLPPMSVPAADIGGEDLANSDSVALFLDRAGSMGTERTDQAEALGQVATIVRHLDGIPLAIELAATRLVTLTPSQLAHRIEDVFSTIGPHPRSLDPRHRTLQATFEWSYQLLSPDEQAGFQALSIMRGDFSLAAAVAVVGGEDGEMIVEGLVDKSILARVPSDEPRVRLLEPLRQFGIARLQRDWREAAMERRDRHFLSLAEEIYGIRTADSPATQERFGRERLHLEATLEHFLGQGRVRDAAEMVAGLGQYWIWHGLYERGREMHEGVVQQSGDQLDGNTLDEILLRLGFLLNHAGEYSECDKVILSAGQSGFDVEDVKWSNLRGSHEALRGNMRAAAIHLERAVELARREQSHMLPAGLINLSAVTAWMGSVERSRRCSAEIPETARRLWKTYTQEMMVLLEGIQARMSGDLGEAESHLREGRELRSLYTPFHLGVALIEWAMVALEIGDPFRAKELVEEALEVAIHPERGPRFIRLRGKQILARVAWLEGDRDLCARILLELVEEAHAFGVPSGLAEAAELTAELAVADGQMNRAAVLLESATQLRERIGLARDAHGNDWYHRIRAQLPRASPVDAARLFDLVVGALHPEHQLPTRTRTKASAADSGAHTSPGRPRS